MSTPLEQAEAELEKVHAAEVATVKPGKSKPARVSEETVSSTYLGHIGEPAIKGKDFA